MKVLLEIIEELIFWVLGLPFILICYFTHVLERPDVAYRSAIFRYRSNRAYEQDCESFNDAYISALKEDVYIDYPPDPKDYYVYDNEKQKRADRVKYIIYLLTLLIIAFFITVLLLFK